MEPRDQRGKRSWARLLAAVGAATLAAVFPAVVAAQPKAPAPAAAASASAEVLGTVLAIQGDELIVDLGSDRGAAEGDVVEIWRPLKLKHPVTGKTLTDRFRIGKLALGQVRSSMALATAEGDLSRPPQKGDVVILARAPAAAGAAQPDGSAPAAERPAAALRPEDREAVAIGKMFDSLRGADLVTRIRKYEDYVRTQPTGRFAGVLYEEAAALRQLLAEEKKPRPRQAEPVERPPELKRFRRPEETVQGTPLRLALEVTDATAGAVLHMRRAGEPAYQSMPMTQAGDGYFAATIPADRLTAPRVEYFIEGTTAKGAAYSLVGNAENPESVEVHEVPKPTAPRKLDASVMLITDFADYNRFVGNDRVWQTEGYFGLRFGDTGVRSLRTGFGVYRGVGGSIQELDELGLNGREVGLTYGYLEAEFGVVRSFAFIGKLAVGLLDDGVSGGGQALVRIGSDQGTNLVLGGELLGGVGLRSITQLEWSSFERFPIVLRTEVTNQPAGASPSSEQRNQEETAQGDGQVGVRGIVQVGFKVVPSFMIAVRGSFQGRTIRHAGPGFGGAVGTTW